MQIPLTDSQKAGMWAVVEVLKHLGMPWVYTSIANESGYQKDKSFRTHSAWAAGMPNIFIYLRRLRAEKRWIATMADITEADGNAKELRFKYCEHGVFQGFEEIDLNAVHPSGYMWDIEACFENPATVPV